MSRPRRLPASWFDLGLAALGLLLSGIATWAPTHPFTAGGVAGPGWLLAVYPLLQAVPLAWRRTAPLTAFCLSMSATVLQALVSGDSTQGLHTIYCWAVGLYAAARFSDNRRAAIALGIFIATDVVYSLENRDLRAGARGDLWAASFFSAAYLAVWLAGVVLRNRREARAASERASALERAAEQAVVEERARLARELHDIVSHNLSVVIVQAAGARATPGAESEALAKIEASGRESMVEMRRLLGVLRHGGGPGPLTPTPGIADLADLVADMGGSGTEVQIRVDPAAESIPPAVALAVYRIVQESLTNVLKHARADRARASVALLPDRVTVEVCDDGLGASANASPDAGHGLVGMRERVTTFGGDLQTGPLATGGYRVYAALPLPERP